MAEEVKKVEKEKVTLTITLPTKETVVKALADLFPGIKVDVQKEPETEKPEEQQS